MATKSALKSIFIFLLILFIFEKPLLAQKQIIVKQIEFKLDYVSDDTYENEYFITLKFTKGIKYIFKVSNHIDDYVGEAIMELLDGDKLVTTNYVSEKYYEQTAFICNKTGFYDILVKYKDNTVGYSTVDIYMVQ